ncbi:hypothetical protein GQ600_1953 [Phytophthora cactorum]|nr:hypothetical protein GQ600_1953 [Phytophthora cactorum]
MTGDRYDSGELNLADLELDQETFVALQRIQAEAAVHRTLAVPAALANRSPSRSRELHKRIRPGGEDSDNDLGVDPDSSSEDKPPIPTDQASSAMSAAGLGDDATAESSSPKPGRRGLHKPKAWKQKKRRKTRPGSQSSVRSDQVKVASHKSSLAVALPISVSHESSTGRPRSRSQSVSSKRATPVSSPPSSFKLRHSASKVLKDDRPPELIDLTSDVEMSSSPEDSPRRHRG